MSLFRIDSSIRHDGSVSREVADTLEQAWVSHHPVGTVVRRDLAVDPLPSDTWTAALSAGFVPAESRTPEQLAALELVTRLADELASAEVVVVAAPLYNFNISQHLRTWIDLVILDPRFAPGEQPLAGRKVTLVIARGGGYGAGTPREGWDHATPYLQRIFGDVLGAEVTVVAAELTLADVKPAMAELRPIAAASREQAHQRAAETGRAHATLATVAA